MAILTVMLTDHNMVRRVGEEKTAKKTPNQQLMKVFLQPKLTILTKSLFIKMLALKKTTRKQSINKGLHNHGK